MALHCLCWPLKVQKVHYMSRWLNNAVTFLDFDPTTATKAEMPASKVKHNRLKKYTSSQAATSNPPGQGCNCTEGNLLLVLQWFSCPQLQESIIKITESWEDKKDIEKNQYQNTGNKEGPNGLTHTTTIFKGPDMLGQKFIHFEHVGGVYAKQVAQFLIANNFALILRILQSILPNVCPELLHNLDHPWTETMIGKNPITLLNLKWVCISDQLIKDDVHICSNSG